MRTAAVIFALGMLALPAGAFAQYYYNNNSYGSDANNSSYNYNVPVYNSSSSVSSTSSGYNSAASPLSLNQYIAGKNAPSYTYGGTQPYSFGANTGGSYGSITIEQSRAIQARQAAQAQAQANGMGGQQYGQYGGLYQPQNQQYAINGEQNTLANILNGQQEKPVKKVYKLKKIDDPLAAPPRLFNPDQ